MPFPSLLIIVISFLFGSISYSFLYFGSNKYSLLLWAVSYTHLDVYKRQKLMGEMGFSYDYIGYKDDMDNIVAGSLVLTKKIKYGRYAYAPKGFLVDYYNASLFKDFFNEVVSYYNKKGCAFIKINPEIIIGELNPKRSFRCV